MPDPGKYMDVVLLAWGGTFLLLGLLVAVTVWQSRAARRALADAGAAGGEGS